MLDHLSTGTSTKVTAAASARPRRSLALALTTSTILSAAMFAGCSVPASDGDEAVASGASAIDNGTVLGANFAEGWGVVWILSPTSTGGTESCTGTVIANQWVLTAQHCFADGTAPLSGPDDRGLVLDNPRTFTTVRMGTQQVTADRHVNHPTLDVSLLHLAQPLRMKGSTTGYSIALAAANEIVVGQSVDCFGTGIDKTNINTVGTLRYAKMPVWAKTSSTFTVARNAWNQAMAHGDSGSTCFTSAGKPMGVLSSGPPNNDDFGYYVASPSFALWTTLAMLWG